MGELENLFGLVYLEGHGKFELCWAWILKKRSLGV